MKNLKDWKIVTFTGEVRMAAVQPLMDLYAHAAENLMPNVAVNLSHTDFIDSTSIGVLVRVHRDISTAGGSMVLMCPNNHILSVLEMLSIDKLIPIIHDRGELAGRAA